MRCFQKVWPDCVSQPRPRAPGAAAEVAWVLVKNRWEYGLCHVIADDQIAIRSAEISAVAGGSLAEGAVLMVNWLFTCDQSARNNVPGAIASSVAILNFSCGVSGR